MLLALAPVALAAASAPSSTEAAIVAAMTDSAAGWNAGDVARFMRVYSESAAASFVTSAGIVRGKPAMIARYRKAYDFADPAKRGTLKFETVDFRPLGVRHALYIARYTLTYPASKRSLRIVFEKNFPYGIVGWEETYESRGKMLTTRAKRTQTLLSDYWAKNAPGDSTLRRELGVDGK